MSFVLASSERRLRRTAWLSVLALAVLSLPFGLSFAAAVAAGGALSALNLEGLTKLVYMLPEGSTAKTSWLALLGVGFRYLLLGIGLFVIVSVWHANVLALSLGLSAPVCAVFLEWGRDAMKEFRRGQGDKDRRF